MRKTRVVNFVGSLLACLQTATAPLDAKLPTAATPENCTLTTTAYVKFGEKVACP